MIKKLCVAIILVIFLFGFSTTFAADEYVFDLSYTGSVVKNVEKDVIVSLIGQNGTLHTSVRIDVDISGPATPQLLAKDSLQTEHDIAQTGYWGPSTGFPVQGTFTNTTNVKATFPEEGRYTITLTLSDLTIPGATISTRTYNIDVFEDEVLVTPIEELPKTGTSVAEYLIYSIAAILMIIMVIVYIKKRKVQ